MVLGVPLPHVSYSLPGRKRSTLVPGAGGRGNNGVNRLLPFLFYFFPRAICVHYSLSTVLVKLSNSILVVAWQEDKVFDENKRIKLDEIQGICGLIDIEDVGWSWWCPRTSNYIARPCVPELATHCLYMFQPDLLVVKKTWFTCRVVFSCWHLLNTRSTYSYILAVNIDISFIG